MPELPLSLWDLLFFPVTVPVRAFLFILDQIREAADRELHDPAVARRHLLELQLLYEQGEVAEEEYRRLWEALTDKLRRLEAGEA
ncbi:MAG: gas vesicle protein GvpG [Clostridia bacterium]|nr:gas vesicle protein GvpG [Clostridia bacterium]